jgi:hypothetical protein
MCDNEPDGIDEDAFVDTDCEPEPYSDGYVGNEIETPPLEGA